MIEKIDVLDSRVLTFKANAMIRLKKPHKEISPVLDELLKMDPGNYQGRMFKAYLKEK